MSNVGASRRRTQFKRILVITGTPGVGKTTVSKALAAKLHAVHIDIAALVRQERMASGYDKTRQTLIADIDRLAKKVQQIMSNTSKTLVVDGHYATDVVPAKHVTRVFVLRCHPEELRQRMNKRGFQGSKVKENLAAEILDVCLADAIANVGEDKICEIDTTHQTADAIVSRILSVLRDKKRCTVGVVDWLGRLEEEGSLDHYLKDF
jgi:adenylate kinase